MNRLTVYSLRLIAFAFILVAFFVALLNTAGAQEPMPIGDVSNGIVIYQQRCANCHGITGMGDGQMAAQAISPPTPLANPEYQSSALPTVMFDTITIGRLQRGMPLFGKGSSNPLSEQERWDVIAAIYALGTNSAELTPQPDLADHLATVDWSANNRTIFDSLPTTDLSEDERWAAINWGRLTFAADYFLGDGTIGGSVVNATSNEPVTDGTITLIAFEELELAQTWEAAIEPDGSYTFNIPNVPADWIFRTTTSFDSLPYNSGFIQLTTDVLTQSESLLVYERTNSAEAVALQELRVVAEINPEQIFFNEFYAYRNDGNAVYGGGTQLFVPDSAENLIFLGITPQGEFFPLDSINPAGDGYFYAEPMVPGESLEILVRYSLPYFDGVTIEHPVAIQPENTSLFVPEEISVAGVWQATQSENFNGEAYTRYNANISDLLSIAIDGNTRFVIDANGNRILQRDENQELLIGGIALAITIAACAYLLNLWQQQSSNDPTALLQEVAALDEAYAGKEIKKKPYEKRRKLLLQQIRDRWPAK